MEIEKLGNRNFYLYTELGQGVLHDGQKYRLNLSLHANPCLIVEIGDNSIETGHRYKVSIESILCDIIDFYIKNQKEQENGTQE